ncbi:pyridine nucleotide-disulfide oxidoreductase [Leptospira wolffii]|uniref:Pyridine nucleotide-disulfide oxidoreductase n=1 Tax=Leptospira wolffii TaxID=409998 RepID=A0A2M9ZAL3_9LEPT|nr:NAD(P)-binding domain-containing protein [Leptospira wolffii]PJZ65460.1 pyridine nucleotide-disulfide oxidoreductase [Leptospira wolffii]
MKKSNQSILSRYFTWLRNDAPEGDKEVFPELDSHFQSSVPGLFVAGDLTGVPLLKYAVESGKNIASSLSPSVGKKKEKDLDLVIVGGGPAGISAGIEASRKGLKYIILEANRSFHTVTSYPKGKPIFAEPEELQPSSPLIIRNGTKEELLSDLSKELKKHKLNLLEGERVDSILRDRKESSRFLVRTESGKEFRSEFVIVAIGKSGDSRRLNIPGEDSENVFHRLIDPKDFEGRKTLVVGGGDSAVEAALALSDTASSVLLSYRSRELSRPKEENRIRFQEAVRENKIRFLPESSPLKIRNGEAILSRKGKEISEKVDSTLVLIGSEPPISFLRKAGIRIRSVFSSGEILGFLALFFFSFSLYFGKASFYGTEWYAWAAAFGWAGFAASLIGWLILRARNFHISLNWNLLRNSYMISAAVYFIIIYFGAKYFGWYLFGKYPSFHYTVLYSSTILFFGLRRMKVRPTPYIKLQTWTLILIQIFPLFLLPEIILPFLGDRGLLGPNNGFLLTQVFPDGAYWKAYGLILAWPLNMGVLYDGSITTFWLIYGFFISFVLIPILVYKYGKGAYCGWICSCGGLAETLGDEFRTRMPHGKLAYKLEHSGQWILLIAAILTLAKLIGSSGRLFWPFEYGADSIKLYYDLIVDMGLGGIIGVGAYFVFSGRIWCRMFCPLSALMHIYARFSKFRIFSDKKRCISCNICTSVCHQGIDVMNYANKGRPMDSVQCVRCSACVVGCPTKVLSFGKIEAGKPVLDRLRATI